jgi:ABC-type bacteriocin/lantibiotic exporter with double-glycine peptidase domain
LTSARVMLQALLLAGAALTLEAQSAIWLDVPFVHQPPEGCGAASIAMVIGYWNAQPGLHADKVDDVASIQQTLYSPKQRGIAASSMADYFRRHNFRVFALSGTWDDLEQHLRKGRPLIAAVRPPGQSQLHYVVIDGIDTAHSLVMFNDPAERKLLTEERASFEKDWSATHNWLLLAVPSSGG